MNARPARVESLDDYTAFCIAVTDLCGIDLLQYRRGQMERRIRVHGERRGVADLEALLALMHEDRAELELFLDRVTINVSQLWRNPDQWKLIGQRVMPELAERGRIRAWSAGSSYGAEAYTLAATALASVPGAAVSITGTDIDRRMVARAREGAFTHEDARDAPARELERFFDRSESGWRAKPELRSLVRFEVGDLLKMEPFPGSYDLVLCRNTVIYFEEPVRDALHARLARSLRPGGYLIVGATERVSHPGPLGLASVRPFTYRKEG